MSINKKFKLDCPKCRNKDKVVMKCSDCNYNCCSSCSINGTCIDCYIALRVKQELNIYMTDKLNMIT